MDKMAQYPKNDSLGNDLLPVEIVLAPQWWYKNTGMTFDEDYFYHPLKRIEAERKMEQVLYDRFGRYGLGLAKDKNLPQVGAVHLAAGFLLSEMFGCRVEYKPDAPPQVIPLSLDDISRLDIDSVYRSPAYKKMLRLIDALQTRHGSITGDINWGGVLNIALDIRGQALFMDMFDRPAAVKEFFNKIAAVLDRFTAYIQSQTGTSSISVNRTVHFFKRPLFLHSECSHTMISVEDYQTFLMDIDRQWSQTRRPFGIHYCGSDPDRYAETFAGIPHLDFLDVGWGGDIRKLREHLPDTFLNIRLSPVEITDMDEAGIRQTIIDSVSQSGNPALTGICCINMDEKVGDEKIRAIFETADELRDKYKQGKL